MLFAEPGIGKTTFLLDFAQHNASKLNHKVAYISFEQIRNTPQFGWQAIPTFKNLVNRKQATHLNIGYFGFLPKLSQFDLVIIDSVNNHLDSDQLETLVRNNPNTDFIFVFQMTKDGKFKGGKADEHLMDLVLKGEKTDDGKSIISATKNRFGVSEEVKVRF